MRSVRYQRHNVSSFLSLPNSARDVMGPIGSALAQWGCSDTPSSKGRWEIGSTCAAAIRLLRKKQLTKRIKRAPQTSRTRDTTQQMAGITYGNCPHGTRRINTYTYKVHKLHQRYVSSIQDGKCELEKAHIRSTSVSQQFLSASFASETGPSFWCLFN